MIFFSNLFITQNRGFDYAGELAIFMASTSFVAIIVGMRWDIEILTKSIDLAGKNILNGAFSIILLSSVLLLLYLATSLIQQNINYVFYAIVFSAFFLAFYELLSNFLLKLNKINFFLVFRCLPYILLMLFSSTQITLITSEIAWFCSILISFLMLVTISWGQLIRLKLFHLESLTSRIHALYSKIIPMISALITNSIILLWLLIIHRNFGEEIVGIWVNLYRIFPLPFALIGAVFLPFYLHSLSSKSSQKKQILKIGELHTAMLVLFLACLAISFFYGNELFQLLTGSKQSIQPTAIYCTLGIGLFQYSLLNWRDLFQSIGREKIFLSVIAIQPISAIFLYFSYIQFSFIGLLLIILAISAFSYFMALILIVYLYYSPLDSQVS
ncbi:hypothetical protein OAC94_01655 [Gammaproteobacteria bacterium]|nr:hypothetical protein [Gammaproteobacteria bacterium]